jgi:hypothetical protein
LAVSVKIFMAGDGFNLWAIGNEVFVLGGECGVAMQEIVREVREIDYGWFWRHHSWNCSVAEFAKFCSMSWEASGSLPEQACSHAC